MKDLWPWLIMLVFLMSGSTIASTNRPVHAAPATERLAQTLIICKTQSIPSGYVIIRQGSSTGCPGSFPNTWTIKLPGTTEVICKISPRPSGYVIIRQGSSTGCPGSFPNTWTIKLPGTTEVICKISSIPSGYVIIREGSSSGCPGSFPNTWTIQRV